MGLVSSASNLIHYLDDASVAKGSAFASQTATVMNLGNNYFASEGYGNYDIFANIVYSSALSAGDVAQLNAACRLAFPILRKAASPILVVIDGHSGTTGFGATFNRNMSRFLQQYLHRPVRLISIGIYGSLASTTDSNFATKSATTYDASRYCIYVMMSGANDITAGATGTAAYNSVKSCCTKAKAAGFNKTVVLPCAYQATQTPTNKTGFDLFNTLCAAGVGVDFDVFADTMADSRINSVAAMSDTAISPDGDHFSSLGQLYEVQTLAPAIGGLIPY
ncbi:MAG TPA: SGNH/GDSL hydrolase family protein [Asticcacaulis sp.]|nr:SGNH/GDSL hydrolase family protein [Asticcacaulis sp.]